MARKSTPPYVTRREFSAVLRTLDERTVLIERLQQTCATQFTRIAQIQFELDEIRAAWLKLTRPKI